ncbi:MAG: amidase family protein [Thermodesulfobacteriota bacterium]
MERFFADHDLLLTPTLEQPPVPVGSQRPAALDRLAMQVLCTAAGGQLLRVDRTRDAILASLVGKSMAGQMPYTPVANLTGQPAITLPLHWTAEGLPIGVQFLARSGDEAGLVRLAGQLEVAKPWGGRRPGRTGMR